MQRVKKKKITFFTPQKIRLEKRTGNFGKRVIIHVNLKLARNDEIPASRVVRSIPTTNRPFLVSRAGSRGFEFNHDRWASC